MTKNILMKAGESKKEIIKDGVLYKNVMKIEDIEANTVHLLPGCNTEGFKHKGQEIKIVLNGEVEYHVGKDKFILQKGDMLFHHSDDKHWAVNKGNKEVIFVTISTPPTFTLFK